MNEDNKLANVFVETVKSELSASSLIPCYVTSGRTEAIGKPIPNVVIYASNITSPIPSVKTLRQAQVNVEVQTYANESETELTNTVLDTMTNLSASRAQGSGSVRIDNIESAVFNGDSIDDQDKTYTQQYSLNVLFAVYR